MADLLTRFSYFMIVLLFACGSAFGQRHVVDSGMIVRPSAEKTAPGRHLQKIQTDTPAGPESLPPPYAVPYGGAYGSAYGNAYGNAYGSAYGYGNSYHVSPHELEFAYRQGRRIEMNRANAADARRRLDQYYRSRNFRGAPHSSAGSPPASSGVSNGNGAYRESGYPLESYHRFGRELEYYRQDELRVREEATLLVHRNFLSRGIRQFRAGQYGEAARSFIAAAEKDHGDTISRLHSGQALVAAGMYPEALGYFRRAFELLPKLIHVPLNLQADYGNKNDYVRHVANLEAYCRDNRNDGPAWLLLAIEKFFGPEPETAAEAYFMAKKLLPKDYLMKRLAITAEPMLRNVRQRTAEPAGNQT